MSLMGKGIRWYMSWRKVSECGMKEHTRVGDEGSEYEVGVREVSMRWGLGK